MRFFLVIMPLYPHHNRLQLMIIHVPQSPLMPFYNISYLIWFFVKEGRGKGIGCYRVSRNNHCIHHLYIIDIAALWSVFYKYSIGINNCQGGMNECCQVCYTFVDVLMKCLSVTTKKAIPVFHSQ